MTTQDHARSAQPKSDGLKPRSLRKRILFWFLYGVFLVVLAEITLQTCYRLTVGQSLLSRDQRPIYAPNEFCGFRTKPRLQLAHNTTEFQTMVYTNSQGFRIAGDKFAYELARDDGRYRIMLLGPSFAFGWGVNHEDTFAARLEQILQEQGYANDRLVELINAGVPALRPARQLNWYAHEGKNFSPDLVIQFIYGDMVVDPELNLGRDMVNAEGYLVMKNSGPLPRLKSHLKKSALIYYMWTTYQKQIAGNLTDEKNTNVGGAGRDMKIHDVFTSQNEEVETADAYYDRLKQVVESSGARLLIVHFPLSYCIHRDDIGRWQHLGVRNVDAQIEYNADYCEYLQGKGIDCVNITEELIGAAASGNRLYYWLDIHWTAEGNAVAAQAVANYLGR